MATSIRWPAALGKCPALFRGLNLVEPSLTIRTPMEVGPAKVRARGTAAARPCEAQVRMTGAQLAIFQDWFRSTLVYGALSFVWFDPQTDAEAEFRFTDVPKYAPLSPRQAGAAEWWAVTLPLEQMPAGFGTTVLNYEDPPGGGNRFYAIETPDTLLLPELAAGDEDMQPLVFEDGPPAEVVWLELLDIPNDAKLLVSSPNIGEPVALQAGIAPSLALIQ